MRRTRGARCIKQRVYPPAERELTYKGSLFARHISGPSTLQVSLRATEGSHEILARAGVEAGSAEWKKYTFLLSLAASKLKPLQPADFVVEVTGDERVQLDQLSLVPADAADGLDPEMVRMARDMHTPLVRFGGNFTSAYHWQDGVGPQDKRVSMLNIAWGIPETNQFGTDEFLRFCRMIDAEPQIALNLGSGTAEEAAGWVRYVNEHSPGHRGGLLWELGNELWGNWNLASPTLAELPDRTRRFSEAIRKIDPQARLIATGQDPDHYQQWNAAQLTNPAGTFDFLSTHFVVTTDRLGAAQPTPDRIALSGYALPVGLGRDLEKMQAQINDKPAFSNQAHLAFTEWLWACCRGNEPANAPKWDNMAGAVITGGFFNMLVSHADIVPISDMTGIIDFAGIWKKHGQVFGTPSYYAFQMYAGADVETPVKTSTNAGSYDVTEGVTRIPDIPRVPYLDVTAALNKAGDRLTLFCVNRHLDRDLEANISLQDFAAHGKAQVRTLSANSIYDGNHEREPRMVTPVDSTANVSGSNVRYTFPRSSVTRIELQK